MFSASRFCFSSVLPTRRFGFAVARKTSAVVLALTLCSTIGSVSPAYGATSKPHANSSSSHAGWQIGVLVPEGRSEAVGEFTPDYTLTTTVRPLVKTYLISFVLYNSKNCKEYTPGNWVLESPSKYGDIYKKEITGKLANGACSHYKFVSDAIYYKWVLDIHATKDKFTARWYADGEYLPWTFDLKLKK
jgi:hypothetical protein